MKKFFAIKMEDLVAVRANLEQFNHAYSDIDDAPPTLGREQFCYDPSMNLIAFTSQIGLAPAEAECVLLQINLQAHDARETLSFFVEIARMTEGTWSARPDRGDFRINPNELAVLAPSGENHGMFVIRPFTEFAYRNGVAHNPTISGHPAFRVPDILHCDVEIERRGHSIFGCRYHRYDRPPSSFIFSLPMSSLRYTKKIFNSQLFQRSRLIKSIFFYLQKYCHIYKFQITILTSIFIFV